MPLVTFAILPPSPPFPPLPFSGAAAIRIIGLAVLELARCGLDTDHRLRVPSRWYFCLASVRLQPPSGSSASRCSSSHDAGSTQNTASGFGAAVTSACISAAATSANAFPMRTFRLFSPCVTVYTVAFLLVRNASTSDERPFLTTQRPHGRCYHFRVVAGGRKCSRTSRDRGT